MRDELEKRLDELSYTRRERDSLRTEQDKLLNQVAEFENNIKKNESMFQRTLELDRSKIQNEIKVKLGRMKTLEDEKEELLREMQSMMSQVSGAQREAKALRLELETANRSIEDLTVQAQSARVQNSELIGELKLCSKKETDLREQNEKIESQYKESLSRLENIVKDSKKNAAIQVMEISNKLKEYEQEAENSKDQMKLIEENEKKVSIENQKLRAELDLAIKSHEEMQQKMSLEVVVLKRDLQDQRTKMKIFQESKAKLETEVLGARTDYARAENSLNKMKDKCKEYELKARASSDECQSLKTELERITNDYKKLKVKVVDLEEGQFKRNKAIEDIVREKEHVN